MSAVNCEAHDLGGCNRANCEDGGACAARPPNERDPRHVELSWGVVLAVGIGALLWALAVAIVVWGWQ